MHKILLTTAISLIAFWAAGAPTADLPKRSTGIPANQVMLQKASPAGDLALQRPRQLSSAFGVYSSPIKLPSAGRAADSGPLPDLHGSVIYADGWTQQNNAIGMYCIGTSDAVPFERCGTARVDATAGGVAIGNDYYASYFVEMYGYYYAYTSKFDMTTWEEDLKWNYSSDMKMMSTGVVYDRTTKNVYGCFYNDSNTGFVFGTADYANKKRTVIKALDRMWSAIAITRKGALYAIDKLGDLYSVDKTTGDMTAIGSTGLVATNPSSACIDPRSGRCFYAVMQGTDGSLYEIDLATAQATLIYHFPLNQEVVGLFVPTPDVEDSAPDAVTDLTLSFADGSLSGTVSFTCPATTFEGEQGEGSLTYIIEANGATVATGQAAWGEKVSKTVTFSVPDNYKFRVYATNATGNGPVTEAEMFVGNDLPMAPEVTATMDNGTVNLSWTPVTASVNGGYIDLNNLSYNVTRLPDNFKVVEGTKLTSVTDTPPAGGTLTGYWYTVTACDGAYTSAESTTRKFWTGSLMPPYSVAFNKEENGEAFTIIDANKDGKTWEWSRYDNAYRSVFNRDADTDDWFVTPPLKLEKGKMYMFTAKLHTYLGNPLRVEIRWGEGDTPEKLTSQLMEPQIIRNRYSEDYSYYLIPEKDGVYYVGIHDITSADSSWFLFADGITVGAGVEAVIPDAVENFMVTPDFNGGKSASVSMTAPRKAVNGTALETITRVDVLRDGTVVKTFSAPAPGSQLEFTDQPETTGYHKYEALAYNAAGAGKKSSLSVYVGANEPAAPAWAKIAETDKPVEVTVSWEPVSTDKDGKPLNPELVEYTIVGAGDGDEAVIIADNIKGSSHTFQALKASENRSFVGYGVRARTDGGYSLMAITDIIPIGTPYAAPWSESFAGGQAASLIRSENREGMWSIYTDESGIPSQDGDNGLAAMFGEFAGADATLYTAKISLAGLDNPALVFYTYNIAGADADKNRIEVSVNGGDGFVTEKQLTVSDLGEDNGWYLAVVPLDKYKGKVIQFAMRGITATHKFTLADNIQVTSLSARNLRVASFDAPLTAVPDKEFFVTVNVENFSTGEASGYRVKLFRNGELIGTETPDALAPGSTAVVKFAQTLGVADPETSEYRAEIEYTADQNADDNTSATETVRLLLPDHPVPANLAGTATETNVTLTWDAPDLTTALPDSKTEDFEGFESWSKTGAEGWTFVDVDRSGVGQIGNFELPGIGYNSLVSWFVTDASLEGLPAAGFAACSGSKYLSTLFCLPDMSGELAEYIANDDWAISPQLYGGAQTISLMARSMNPSEAQESFEILASTTDSDSPADFTLVEQITNVPGTWTQYRFYLPKGTKRFAIRYNHTFGLSLGVDDVTFIPAGTSSLVVEGYNVYRDGKRVNTTPVKETTFTDPIKLTDEAEYAVTAVYENRGESRLSAPLRLKYSGVTDIAAGGNATVSAAKGAILVENAEGMTVSVTDTAGRVIARTEGSATIPVAPGVYIVKVGATVVKVLVH